MNSGLQIGILAVQGAFAEHAASLSRLGVETFEIRGRKDLDKPFNGIVLPGGESTVQGKLLRSLGLLEPLRERISGGLPVLATCAGLILLAERLSDGSPGVFGTLPVTVRRNAYGRQLGSFSVRGNVEGVGSVPMTFIRAPVVERVGDGVRVLSRVDGKIVAVQCEKQMALSFHPELSADLRVHESFLSLCSG